MAEILRPTFVTTNSVPVDDVLVGGRAAGLKSVLVIGENADGALYLASSSGDRPEILWLLELAKHQLLDRAGSR